MLSLRPPNIGEEARLKDYICNVMDTKTKNHFVYIARCKDNTLYTGKTTDLEKRIQKHNSGRGSKYIQAHGNAEIVYFEKFDNNLDACRREILIKKWRKDKKEFLIKNNLSNS